MYPMNMSKSRIPVVDETANLVFVFLSRLSEYLSYSLDQYALISAIRSNEPFLFKCWVLSNTKNLEKATRS